MGNDTFTLTKNYSDGDFWTEAYADASFNSIVTHMNSVYKDNFDQLKADLFPNTYTYDDDAAANLTNPLYDKQVATDFYDANISIGTSTDVAYTAVDATNAALTFTPELAGNYRVTFMFTWNAAASGGTAIDVETQFRLIDGNSNASYGVQCAIDSDANNVSVSQGVTLTHIFNFTAVSQTITLQKRNTIATNVAVNQVAGSTGNYALFMSAEKI